MKTSVERKKIKKICSTACFLNKFLYTNEINKLGFNNESLKKYFLGAFPADIIPENIKFPSCWIWNTDESNASGTHWIAVWVTAEKCYFFDSFAKSPRFYNRNYWYEPAKKLNVKFVCVRKRALQVKNTYVCGNWSLLYLYNKSKKIKNINVKYKRKINNDIKLKNIMLKKFGNEIKIIYKQKCKEDKKMNKNVVVF